MRFGNLFQEFVNSEKAGGITLFFCTVISLVLANSAFGPGYIQFWEQPVNLSAGALHLDLTLSHWINDGLMTIFFLLVGLEIERELYSGELQSARAAALPVAGALGGMLIPALIHFSFNQGTITSNGYGIPMGTDIAFALGILSLAGKRIPFSLKIFLTALAIIDDIGAILIIAVFYNTGLSFTNLFIALGIFGLLLLMNRLKVNKLVFYLLPGVAMWYFMHLSGVHATISGVLLAFAIPFGKHDDKNISYHLQHWLHKPVAFIILPLFALANTAIFLAPGWYNNLTGNNGLGIVLGLVVGKPVGILIFCWLLTKLNWGALPEQITWKHIAGAGMLGGIGFTMSMFVANLAFRDHILIQSSKVAVLIASLIATVIGLCYLFLTSKKPGHDTNSNTGKLHT